jgi:hypothetical protein
VLGHIVNSNGDDGVHEFYAPQCAVLFDVGVSNVVSFGCAASQLVPSREHFFEKMDPEPGEDLMESMHLATTKFSPLLADVHKFLSESGLDDPTKV